MKKTLTRSEQRRIEAMKPLKKRIKRTVMTARQVKTK